MVSALTWPAPCSWPLATTPTGFAPRQPSPASAGSRRCRPARGKTHRHRLNRGGDRQANNALWRIVFVRLAHDPRTRTHVERRTAEGLSRRYLLRCLKRYVAREVFLALRPLTAPTPVAS